MKKIPLVRTDDPQEEICWVELRQAQCLLNAPSSPWIYARVHYMSRIADYQERLRQLEQNLVKNHIGVK